MSSVLKNVIVKRIIRGEDYQWKEFKSFQSSDFNMKNVILSILNDIFSVNVVDEVYDE